MKLLKQRLACALLGVTGTAGIAAGQAVGAHNQGERTLMIVPMVGAGTYEDPRRPLVMPRTGSGMPAGVLAIRFEESDDGKFALVEVVAVDRKSLNAAVAPVASRSDVRRFDKGSARKVDIEEEFRARKKNFDLDRFVEGGSDVKRAVEVTPGNGAR